MCVYIYIYMRGTYHRVLLLLLLLLLSFLAPIWYVPNTDYLTPFASKAAHAVHRRPRTLRSPARKSLRLLILSLSLSLTHTHTHTHP